MHNAFLYIALPSYTCNYDVKWPNFKFFEDGNGKAINSSISVRTRAWPPLLSSNINSLLLSNRATWGNREMVWKDAGSIFFSEVFMDVAVVGSIVRSLTESLGNNDDGSYKIFTNSTNVGRSRCRHRFRCLSLAQKNVFASWTRRSW